MRRYLTTVGVRVVGTWDLPVLSKMAGSGEIERNLTQYGVLDGPHRLATLSGG